MQNDDLGESKIDWTKYFDRIWCISFIPYRSRREAIKREFDRIGISKHPKFEWNLTFDSPYFKMCKTVLDANPPLGKLHSDTELKCWAGHYSCIKRSVLFGDERILIIEDDSRFLNDISRIKLILENMPNDYDIVMFDHSVNVPKNVYDDYKNRKVNGFYSEFEDLSSTGCYSLSRKALLKLESLYDSFIIPTDNYFSKLGDIGLKKCFSLTNLSCQATYSSSMSVVNAGINTIHSVYAKSNIVYSDYNMNDGKPYTYGSYIMEEKT